MKTAKGELKVQFFSNLALIRRRYEEGAVVAKLLHKELLEAGKITIPYQSFSIYFRREIVAKALLIKEPKIIKVSSEIDEDSPIIIRTGTDTQKKFNPHAVEIDAKNKW